MFEIAIFTNRISKDTNHNAKYLNYSIMGKITVKHYLNTNLKPYIINGENYYSIYVLIRANRQNTKVKSKCFEEYYTESDFEEIISNENTDDNKRLKDEITALELIAELLLDMFGKFDTVLYSAIFQHFTNIFISDIDIERGVVHCNHDTANVNLYDERKNRLGIGIDKFIFGEYSMGENHSKGMDLFTWFSKTGQSELVEFLSENANDEDLKTLNKIVFISSFDKLDWIFKGSKKLEPLIDKYDRLFTEPSFYLESLYLSLKK